MLHRFRRNWKIVKKWKCGGNCPLRGISELYVCSTMIPQLSQTIHTISCAFQYVFLHKIRGLQIIKFGTQLQFEKCSFGSKKFQRKAYVDIQLCTLQNAFSREAAFQILRTKYQIRSLEELINPSIGTMSMRCHEKFPDRSINPFSRR